MSAARSLWARVAAEVAIVDAAAAAGDEVWTFADVGRVTAAVRQQLQAALPAGGTVALCIPRSGVLLCAMLACIEAGLPFYLVDLEQPGPFCAAALDDVRPTLVVHVGALPEWVALLEAEAPARFLQLDAVTLAAGAAAGAAAEAPACRTAAPAGCVTAPGLDAPAPLYLMHTSGSTGGRKLVRASADGTLTRLAWMWLHPRYGLQTYVGASADACRSLGLHAPLVGSAAVGGDGSGSSYLEPAATAPVPAADVTIWKTPVSFVDTIAEALTAVLVCAKTVVLCAAATDACAAALAAGQHGMSGVGAGASAAACSPPASGDSISIAHSLRRPQSVIPVARLASAIDAHRVTRLTCLPSVLHALLALASIAPPSTGGVCNLASLRLVCVSGEPLPWHTLARYREHFALRASSPQPILLNVYGCCEASADSAYLECQDIPISAGVPAATPFVPVGQALQGTAITLQPIGPDASRGDVPSAVTAAVPEWKRLTPIGRVLISGAGVALGYAANATDTDGGAGSAGFTSQGFLTSDMGALVCRCLCAASGSQLAAVAEAIAVPTACPGGCGAPALLTITGRMPTADAHAPASYMVYGAFKVAGESIDLWIIERLLATISSVAVDARTPGAVVSAGPAAAFHRKQWMVSWQHAIGLARSPAESPSLHVFVNMLRAEVEAAAVLATGDAHASVAVSLLDSAGRVLASEDGIGTMHAGIARLLVDFMRASVPSSHIPALPNVHVFGTGLGEASPLPLTPSGKADKRAMYELALSSPHATADDKSPSSSLPQQVVENIVLHAFRSALAMRQGSAAGSAADCRASISAAEDFFDCGGDSIAAVHALSGLLADLTTCSAFCASDVPALQAGPLSFDGIYAHRTAKALAAALLACPHSKTAAAHAAGASSGMAASAAPQLKLGVASLLAPSHEMWHVQADGAHNLGGCIDAKPLLIDVDDEEEEDAGHAVNTSSAATAAAATGGSSRSATACRVVVGSHSGAVACFDFTGRELLWLTKLPDRVQASAALHRASGTACVGCFDGCLYAFDVRHGTLRWWYDLAGGVGNAASYGASGAQPPPHWTTHRRHVEIADVDAAGVSPPPPKRRRIEASGDESGGDAAAGVVATPAVAPRPELPIKCTAAVAGNGSVFVGGYDRALSIIDVTAAADPMAVESGSVGGRAPRGTGCWQASCRTRIALPGSLVASPVVDDTAAIVICATTSGHVLAVAQATGAVVWQVDVGAPVFASPVLLRTTPFACTVLVATVGGDVLVVIDGSIATRHSLGPKAAMFAAPLVLPLPMTPPTASTSIAAFEWQLIAASQAPAVHLLSLCHASTGADPPWAITLVATTPLATAAGASSATLPPATFTSSPVALDATGERTIVFDTHGGAHVVHGRSGDVQVVPRVCGPVFGGASVATRGLVGTSGPSSVCGCLGDHDDNLVWWSAAVAAGNEAVA